MTLSERKELEKRLSRLEAKLKGAPDWNVIIFDALEGETLEQHKERFACWESGETVNGMDIPYPSDLDRG